jgi:hypothetical protein
MKAFPVCEQTKLWRVPKLGNLELMHAAYLTQTIVMSGLYILKANWC